MERLTLDKDVKDMGYMDLAHNMTFAKDGEIWYHNFTDEISLRNLIRRLCENFNIDIEMAVNTIKNATDEEVKLALAEMEGAE